MFFPPLSNDTYAFEKAVTPPQLQHYNVRTRRVRFRRNVSIDKYFLRLFVPSRPWLLYVYCTSSAARVKIGERWNGTERTTPINPSERGNSLVYAPNTTCDDFWLSWPPIQERAMADGTVLIFDVFNSVGNLFVTFDLMIKVDQC